MTEQEIIQALQQRCDPILIGYGGSHAYGTNIPTSDIDIRGIYINPENEFIGTKPDSEQITLPNEDVTIYSIKKMFHLLSQCNPNTIEILGLRPEHYLFLSPAGHQIVDNANLFLSQNAINTFGAYAKAQLNRLMNKSGRGKKEEPKNETRSLQKTIQTLKRDEHIQNIKAEYINGTPTIYINEAMPIDQFHRIAQNILNVHNDYKHSVRNTKAIEHGKLAKHMMHLVRLYMMGIDLLEKQEIITYREQEHDLLMSIRFGEYLEADQMTPTKEFEELLQKYTAKFEHAASITTLPKQPNYDAINQLMIRIVKAHYDY